MDPEGLLSNALRSDHGFSIVVVGRGPTGGHAQLAINETFIQPRIKPRVKDKRHSFEPAAWFKANIHQEFV